MQRLQFRVRQQDTGAPLWSFLARQLGLSGRKAKNLLDQRCVFVNGSRIWMATEGGGCVGVDVGVWVNTD